MKDDIGWQTVCVCRQSGPLICTGHGVVSNSSALLCNSAVWVDQLKKTLHSTHYILLVLYQFLSVLALTSVAEVLEKHSLQKPISYVKNSQNSEEEAHELMVKLCRHTGRRYWILNAFINKKQRWTDVSLTCARWQETSCERDGVEGAAAGPARHAAECLHLSETGDVPPGNRLKKCIHQSNSGMWSSPFSLNLKWQCSLWVKYLMQSVCLHPLLIMTVFLMQYKSHKQQAFFWI